MDHTSKNWKNFAVQIAKLNKLDENLENFKPEQVNYFLLNEIFTKKKFFENIRNSQFSSNSTK